MKKIVTSLRYVSFLGLAATVLGTVVALTVRDRSQLASVVFYSTPWLARLIASLAAFIFLSRQRIASAAALLCFFIAAFHGWESHRSDLPPERVPENALHVTFWNAARRLYKRPDLWRLQGEADVSALVETGPFTDPQFKAFQAINTGQQWKRLDPETTIGVRGKILSYQDLGIPGRLRCHRLQVSIPSKGEFTIVVVDIRSKVTISREIALRKVLQSVRGNPRCIILGDFNTPSESCFLDDWRADGLTLANDGPRQGFRETWPYGLPLLTLDQVWTGTALKSISAIQSRPGYDHDRLELQFIENH
jgi:hypothetical protein